MTLEALAGIELPEEQTKEEEEGPAESGDDKASILNDFLVLLDRAGMRESPAGAKKDGDGTGGKLDRMGSATQRNKRAPARKPPPHAPTRESSCRRVIEGLSTRRGRSGMGPGPRSRDMEGAE